MWGDMSLWNVQGALLHSGDHFVLRILTELDYTFIGFKLRLNFSKFMEIMPRRPNE